MIRVDIKRPMAMSRAALKTPYLLLLYGVWYGMNTLKASIFSVDLLQTWLSNIS